MRFLTTRQAGEFCGAPEWQVRRIVDRLGQPVERFGLKRMIPASLLPAIAEAINEKRGDELESQPEVLAR